MSDNKQFKEDQIRYFENHLKLIPCTSESYRILSDGIIQLRKK